MVFKNISLLLSALLTMTLVIVLILVVVIFGEMKGQRIQTNSLLAAVNQRVGVVSNTANDFINSTSKDMLLLQSFLSEEGSGVSWSEASLEKFMEHSSAYEELYLFGSNGGCLSRVIRKPTVASLPCGAAPEVVEVSRARAGELSLGELHASSLLRYKDKLSLVYSMPLRDERVLVAVISAEEMMEEVRRLARADELVFLVDSEGGYLAHPNRLKEKFLGATDNFYTDFPEVHMPVLTDEDAHRLDTEHALLSFWRIHPFESNFALYQGTRHVEGGAPEREQWILVAVSEKSK